MTSFKLKILALLLMVIDHMAYWWYDFFPIWFHWLGRASAPIFIFCLVHSYDKTHSKTKFLMRLYFFSVCVSAINTLLMWIGYIFVGDPIASNDLRTFSIPSTLFIICLIIRILQIESARKKYALLGCFLVWQVIWSIFLTYIAYLPLPWFEWGQSGFLSFFVQLFSSITGNILWTEGSILYVLFGVLLYYAKEKRSSLILLFIGFSLFYFLYSLTSWNLYIISAILDVVSAYTGSEICRYLVERAFETALLASFGEGCYSLFFIDYQWMMIGALPIILLYNGKRGHSYKYAFYMFYPLHIYILWIARALYEFHG